MLKSFSQLGVESASLPCWQENKRTQRSSRKDERVYLSREIKEQLQKLYGTVSSLASDIRETMDGDISYCYNGKSSMSGNAKIGFISCEKEEYHVGTIKRILKVTFLGKREGAISEAIIFLVSRYQKTPGIFCSHLWENVLAHNALGITIVDNREEERVEVVPLDRVIGHVAVRRIDNRFGSALLTLQLTKVYDKF
jgi:hypothetical protein